MIRSGVNPSFVISGHESKAEPQNTQNRKENTERGGLKIYIAWQGVCFAGVAERGVKVAFLMCDTAHTERGSFS